MPNDTTVRAPYNFVPFSNKILPYQRNELPAHDAVDPALKTGEIHVTFTADTPVFVSDGRKNDPHFFRGPDGTLQIPGSSVRGMIRANMQILGFGLVRVGEDMEDQRAFYRKVADARQSVGGELKNYYDATLAVQVQRGPSGKSRAIPRNVKAGYLRKEGGKYYIQPVSGSYLRVSKKTLANAGLDQRYAQTIPVRYRADGERVTAVFRANGPDTGRNGVLLCPGVDINGDGTRGKSPKPPAHRYIFPPADETADPVGISKEDELAYAADWENRENSLKGGTKLNGQTVRYDPAFWKLPEEGQEKPVFYIQHDGHVFWGMTLFLRIGYRNTLREGLPRSHREKQDRTDFLDWPRAILGWAGDETSYRSRVSFGDFRAQGDPKESAPFKTVLSAPKISYYPGYVVHGDHYNKSRSGEGKDDGFRLRGYKQYWLKTAQPEPAEKDNVASQLRPLPIGTKFRGVIRYKNLRPEELGLLLWAIRLEEGCYQSVGMGKPYGFGRVKASIDALREFDLGGLYTPQNLCAAPAAAPDGAVQAYIDAYDAAASQAMHLKKPKKRPSVTSLEEIKDFFYLKRTIRAQDEVSYMTLAEYQNTRWPLPDTASFRREAEEAALAAAPGDTSVEALIKRINHR